MQHFIHYQNYSSKELNIILPGSSAGFQTGFIYKIFNKFVAEGKSAIAFNYPFLDRGEETSSGKELTEELEALDEVLKIVDIQQYSKINFIGKSLGAIVASSFLKKTENDVLLSRSTLSILGYVRGSINLENVNCKVLIVQGENDRFGNIDEVKQDLQQMNPSNISYVQIPKADHSFRDENKNPIFEEEAIEALMTFLLD